ncbi:hypothetical protein B0H12DRAFT_525729 [Mycena haematopus]|nr:hypothetical protein B0H12DRAFT_525729 [Mycena haematopus]
MSPLMPINIQATLAPSESAESWPSASAASTSSSASSAGVYHYVPTRRRRRIPSAPKPRPQRTPRALPPREAAGGGCACIAVRGVGTRGGVVVRGDRARQEAAARAGVWRGAATKSEPGCPRRHQSQPQRAWCRGRLADQSGYGGSSDTRSGIPPTSDRTRRHRAFQFQLQEKRGRGIEDSEVYG